MKNCLPVKFVLEQYFETLIQKNIINIFKNHFKIVEFYRHTKSNVIGRIKNEKLE